MLPEIFLWIFQPKLMLIGIILLIYAKALH